MVLDVSIVGAFLEELCCSRGGINDRRCINSWLRIRVGLERADAFPSFLVVHAPHAEIAVIARAGKHCAGHVPSDAPDGAVVVIELSSEVHLEAVAAGLVNDGLEVEDADVF